MKILIFLFLTTTCLAQDNLYIKRSDLKPITVTPERPTTFTVQKHTQLLPIDLAIEKIDTTRDVIVTVTVVNVSPPRPQKFRIEAESATSIVNATRDASTGNTTICCINTNAVISYDNVNFKKQTKLRIRFARGNPGNGQLTFRIGGKNIPVSFPSTGGWNTWQEVTVDVEPIEGDRPVQILSSTLGPCNLDWFEFE